jgi:hypothetical protein
MTDGEKMVWAAVFAKELNLRDPPSWCLVGEDSDNEWVKWEASQTQQAIEAAGYAIAHLREAEPGVYSGHGSSGIVAECYSELIKESE